MPTLKKLPKLENKIPWANPILFGNEREYLLQAFETNWITKGPFTKSFEQKFLKELGIEYGLCVGNGTIALYLAMQTIDVQPGDEVIVPGLTYVAPANMVIAKNATPVYCDIDPQTWCLDPHQLKKLISPRTKAIIPVHLFGNVCQMDKILAIAQEHNVSIIEDVAEATFSKFDNKSAGAFGDCGCFSFHAAKTIPMGEGGFIVFKDQEKFEFARKVADQGMDTHRRYFHDQIGFNFRITDLQAAIGCGQLDYLNVIVDGKQKVYRLYKELLKDEDGVQLQQVNSDVDPLMWAIALQLDPDYFELSRDEIIAELKELGIDTRPGFYAFSQMPIYNAPSLPIAEKVGQTTIVLPSFFSLREDQMKTIVQYLLHFRR